MITPCNYTETIDVMLNCVIVFTFLLSTGLSTSNRIFVMRRNNQNIITAISRDNAEIITLNIARFEYVRRNFSALL